MTKVMSAVLVFLVQSAIAQTTFHGNNARTGIYDSTGPTAFNGVQWSFKTSGPIVSSPAVANGVFYFVAYDGTLYALAAETGEIKWRFATGGERRYEAKGIHGLTPSDQNIADPMDLFLSSPSVVDHRVYFGSSDGHVYALNADTGVLAWSFETRDIVHPLPPW